MKKRYIQGINGTYGIPTLIGLKITKHKDAVVLGGVIY